MKRLFVFGKIHSGFFFEFGDDVINDAVIKVISTEESITIGRFNFENTVTQLEDGDIEGPTTQVINNNGFIFSFIQTVCQRGGSGFIDDPLDVESGYFPCLFGSLALRVVEVRRNGDDSVGDGSAEICLSVGFGFLKYLGGDFLRSVILVTYFNHGRTIFVFNNFIRDHFLSLLRLFAGIFLAH